MNTPQCPILRLSGVTKPTSVEGTGNRVLSLEHADRGDGRVPVLHMAVATQTLPDTEGECLRWGHLWAP